VTADALRTALSRLGLSQAAFAHYIGVHRLTVLHWLDGTYPVPRTVEVIIELLERAEK
jgi:DNA-binding transcriptional regulator YiaG